MKIATTATATAEEEDVKPGMGDRGGWKTKTENNETKQKTQIENEQNADR